MHGRMIDIIVQIPSRSNSNTGELTSRRSIRKIARPILSLLLHALLPVSDSSPFSLIFFSSFASPVARYRLPSMNLRGPPPITLSSSGGGTGGREDCWSEGATATLVEAWGDRYLGLNRGNLRQKDWQEVADAVNSRQNGAKSKKTDVQCKNRIDTLKKKYKLEKAKPPPSTWPFFKRMESLIGANASGDKKHPSVTLTVKAKAPSFMKGPKSRESSFEEDEDGDDDEVRKEHRVEDVGLSDGAACRELARAILKLGEIYERIESSKQQQMMELEKQRMEFTKDLEFQRMTMFVDAHLEMQKSKRQKHLTRSGCS